MTLFQFLGTAFYIFVLPLAVSYVLASFKPVSTVIDKLFFNDYED